jgi:hypothetical protein
MMAKAEIFAGNCGFNTTVEATTMEDVVQIKMQSDCAAIMKMAAELTEVNPYKEISSRRAVPATLQAGLKYCTHAACPVPVGIIKAVEVEAGLALPMDATIKVSKE